MTANHLTRSRIDRVVKVLPELVGHKSAQGSLDTGEYPIEVLLQDYFRVVEIAHFVRRGGVKAMLYRLEIGKTKFSPTDYLDGAHDCLLAAYRDVYKPLTHTEGSLLEALKGVSSDEEEGVREVLPQLDAYLLADRRKESDD